MSDIHVVAWSGGHDVPSYHACHSLDTAWKLADKWWADADETTDTIDVLTIKETPTGLTVERIARAPHGDSVQTRGEAMTDTYTATATDPHVGDTFTIGRYGDDRDVIVLYADDLRVLVIDPTGGYGDEVYSREQFAELVATATPKPAAELPLTFWVEVSSFDGRFGVNRHEITGNRADAWYEPQSRRDGCQWVQVQVIRRLAAE